MTNATIKTQSTFNNALYMKLGFLMGLACMAALFIAGLVKGNVGMVVMASSMAAMLGAVWSSTSAAMKKKAAAAAA